MNSIFPFTFSVEGRGWLPFLQTTVGTVIGSALVYYVLARALTAGIHAGWDSGLF